MPLDLGSLLGSVSTVHVVTCLATIVVTPTAVAGMLYHAQRGIRLVEPDAALIVLRVITSIAAAYILRSDLRSLERVRVRPMPESDAPPVAAARRPADNTQ